jgi:hypothetical protein
MRIIKLRCKNHDSASLWDKSAKFVGKASKNNDFLVSGACHIFVSIVSYSQKTRCSGEGADMIYHEIVRTCSNAHVAEAAVQSLGGEIALVLSESADRVAMWRGDLAAKWVRDFDESADASDKGRVLAAAQGSQHPILSGLRYILERGAQSNSAWMTGRRI